jgi:hypothetical protein
LLIGLLAVGAAIAAPPVGFQWFTGPGGLLEPVPNLVRGTTS